MQSHSTVDRQRFALNEIAQSAREEKNRVRDIGRLEHAVADQSASLAAREHRLRSRQSPSGIGFHKAGFHDVEVNATSTEFQGEMPHE